MGSKERLQVNNTQIANYTSAIRKFPKYTKPEGLYIWQKFTELNGTFINYVVSNNENEYPNNGILGNFYYTKVNDAAEVKY